MQYRPLRMDDAGEIHAWLEGHAKPRGARSSICNADTGWWRRRCGLKLSTFLARRADKSRTPRMKRRAFPIWSCRPDRTSARALRGVTGCRTTVRAGLRDFNPFTLRMSPPVFSASTRNRTACGRLRGALPKSATPHFPGPARWMWRSSDPLHSAPARCSESWMADQRMGIQPARVTGRTRPSARKCNPLKLNRFPAPCTLPQDCKCCSILPPRHGSCCYCHASLGYASPM